jgi:hypothetical protein
VRLEHSPALLGVELKRSYFGSLPAILDKRLFGERGFVHRQVEYILVFFHLHKKCLDMHPLLPKSGNYFARQSGAPRNPKLKLFYLGHDHHTYETRCSEERSIQLTTLVAGQIVIHTDSNHLPASFEPLLPGAYVSFAETSHFVARVEKAFLAIRATRGAEVSVSPAALLRRFR